MGDSRDDTSGVDAHHAIPSNWRKTSLMKYLLPIIAFFLLAPSAFAAIAFDAGEHVDGAANTDTLTISHTSTGSNLIMFVCPFSSNYGSQTDVVTGVTYNGVSLTRINTAVMPTSDDRVYLYYLAGPATGTHNVVISANSGNAGRTLSGNVATYSGASQTGIPDAQTTTNGSAITSLTGTLTTVADNTWLVGCGRNDITNTPTAGTNTFMRIQDSRSLVDTNAAQTPAGSHSITVNVSSQTQMNMALASFAPFVAASVALPSILSLVWSMWIN